MIEKRAGLRPVTPSGAVAFWLVIAACANVESFTDNEVHYDAQLTGLQVPTLVGGAAGVNPSGPGNAGVGGTPPASGGRGGSGSGNVAGAASGGAAGANSQGGGAGGASGSGGNTAVAGSGSGGAGGAPPNTSFDPAACNFVDRTGCEAFGCDSADCPAGGGCRTRCTPIDDCLAANASCVTADDPLCAVRAQGAPNACTNEVDRGGGLNAPLQAPVQVMLDLVDCLCRAGRL
jgi:hypothetical protein